MGAPVGVFVMAPIGMQIARKHGIDHATVEPEFGHCADAERAHIH